jgi:hypothetical protein
MHGSLGLAIRPGLWRTSLGRRQKNVTIVVVVNSTRYLVPTEVIVWFLAILCYSQSGDDPHEGLANFGYKINIKIIYFEKNCSIFFTTSFNRVYRLAKFLKFWLNFEKISNPHDFKFYYSILA